MLFTRLRTQLYTPPFSYQEPPLPLALGKPVNKMLTTAKAPQGHKKTCSDIGHCVNRSILKYTQQTGLAKILLQSDT